MKRSAVAYAGVGFTVIKLKGKKPVEKNWTNIKYRKPEEVAQLFDKWNGNFGVLLGSQNLVIDYDPRNEKVGDHPLHRLVSETGLVLTETAFIVQTGGSDNGIHAYLSLPPDFSVAENLPEYKGIEFKSIGRQVVGVGSIHPETGKQYTWLEKSQKLGDIQPAPQALLDLIKTQPKKKSHKKDIGGNKDEDPIILAKYIEILQKADPAVEGSSGDKTTFKMACKGWDLGFSEDKTYTLMSEHYNLRCEPPWPEHELLEKIENAYKYAKGSKGGDLAETDFGTIEIDDPDDEGPIVWARFKGGILKPISDNVNEFFRFSDSPLHKTLVFNEFTQEILVVKPLPWWPNKKIAMPKKGITWIGRDNILGRAWFARNKKFYTSANEVGEGALVRASKRSFHPIKEYLTNLQWDGISRLEEWLIRCGNAADNIYTRAVSKTMILQAVDRIYNPGCKVDTMVILEGPQGVGKSTLIEKLGGEFYGVIASLDPSDKDTIMKMNRLWIIEIAEMTAYKKTDAQKIKSFLSTTHDEIRFPYDPKPQTLARSSIFIGSMNPPPTGEYLPDETGNRRSLPIWLGGFLVNGDYKINRDLVAELRDQLFAEATERILKGEISYIDDPEVLKMAGKEQHRRQVGEPWITRIKEWIEEKRLHFLTSRDVWVHAMLGNDIGFGHAERARVTRCLKELGYVDKVIWREGKSVRGYAKEEYTTDESDIFS